MSTGKEVISPCELSLHDVSMGWLVRGAHHPLSPSESLNTMYFFKNNSSKVASARRYNNQLCVQMYEFISTQYEHMAIYQTYNQESYQILSSPFSLRNSFRETGNSFSNSPLWNLFSSSVKRNLPQKSSSGIVQGWENSSIHLFLWLSTEQRGSSPSTLFHQEDLWTCQISLVWTPRLKLLSNHENFSIIWSYKRWSTQRDAGRCPHTETTNHEG